MEERSGRLWPLWLYPALCAAAVAAVVAAALGAPEGRPPEFGAGWPVAFAVATLPGYGAAVGLLRERLARLPLRRVALAALVAAVGTPLALALCALAASRLPYAGAIRPAADALVLAGLLIAPGTAVSLGYLAARPRMASRPRQV